MTIEAKLGVFGRLEAARSALEAVLEEHSTEEFASRRMYGEGGWKAREALCHLAGLDEVAAADMARVKSGGIPQLSTWKPEDSDWWNDFFVKTRANFTDQQVLEELFSARWRFLAELASVPDALFEEGSFPRVLCDLVAGHDQHHVEELRAALA